MLHDSAFRVSRREWLLLGAAILPAGRLLAWQDQADKAQQDKPGDPSFSTGVSVVNVLVSVRDKQGKIVHDLTKDDFTLDEEGRPVVIKYFAQQADMPLTLGLLIDTSESQRRLIDQERSASRDFFQHVLREDKDKAFVIHFDSEVELLQDLTSSRRELNTAIDQVESKRPQLNRRDPNQFSSGGQEFQGYPRGGGSQRGGDSPGGRRGGTELYDAILLGSDELMKKQQGRKAMIVLSDGVDRGSRVTIGEAIESAQRADTLVYAIRFADSSMSDRGGGGGGMGGPRIGMGGGGIGGIGGMGGGGRRGGNQGGGNRNPEPRVDGKKILEQIARETGGAYFDVSSKMPLDKIYDRIEEDLRNQYSLGFTPDPSSGGGYHKLHVMTKAKNAVLVAREGYYAR